MYSNSSLQAEGVQANADQVSTDIGVFTFTKNVKTGKAVVRNNAKIEHYVYFSVTNNDGSLSSKHLLIDGETQKDVTALMTRYVEGQITYAPFAGDGPQDVLSFSAETMFNRRLEFNDDDSQVQYILEQNVECTQLIFSSKHPFGPFEMTFSDKNGVNFNVRDSTIDEVQDLHVAQVDIPKGCSHELPYTNLQLQVTIPEKTSRLIRDEMEKWDMQV